MTEDTVSTKVKVVVEPDAQKTDGKMMVQSLLLSDAAAMSSKPELEIFADDVQCGPRFYDRSN